MIHQIAQSQKRCPLGWELSFLALTVKSVCYSLECLGKLELHAAVSLLGGHLGCPNSVSVLWLVAAPTLMFGAVPVLLVIDSLGTAFLTVCW